MYSVRMNGDNMDIFVVIFGRGGGGGIIALLALFAFIIFMVIPLPDNTLGSILEPLRQLILHVILLIILWPIMKIFEWLGEHPVVFAIVVVILVALLILAIVRLVQWIKSKKKK